jgi:(p)ppGpp synthase/HD superfamily hydrolase
MEALMSLIHDASVFAFAAHRAIGQRRKYTGDCYTNHTRAVAQMVSMHGLNEHAVAAAHLHDVVEDTHIAHEDIYQMFGTRVADLVWHLTDEVTDGANRATRKARDRARLAVAPADAQSIKLADLIDNTKSIIRHDRAFAKVYLAEMQMLLDVLNKGDASLRTLARSVLNNGLEELG